VAQLSPPFRIALVALLAFVAVWFTVLRPETATEPTPAAPGVTGLANGVNAAEGAASAANESAAAAESAANGTAASRETTGPATSTAKARAARARERGAAVEGIAPGDRSKPLVRALADDRVVAVLFWNRKGSDDRAVRRALSAADRHDGKVVTKVVPVANVGRYQAITRGAQVLESPTLLVIGPDRVARPIVGYTTRAELDQAIGDALAARR
jgi:hypothetical protein